MFSDLVGSTALERLAAEPHTRLRNFCSPQHTDSALYPTIGQIERAAGFRHDDSTQAKLDKLDALLSQSATSLPDAALLAEMLSPRNDGRYPAVERPPASTWKDVTIRRLLNMMHCQSGRAVQSRTWSPLSLS
jgi:hypothetical protein